MRAGDAVAMAARSTSSLTVLADRYGSRALPLSVDVADRAAVSDAVRSAHRHFGRLDVLVNNAGYGLAGAVEEVDEAEVRRQFEVNVFGSLWCIQDALPIMREQGRGHIVQVTSLGGLTSFPNCSMYHGTKWAMEGIAEALALEVGAFGIRVTILEPGPFRTDWWGGGMERSAPMPEYDDVLRSARELLSGNAVGTQPGDPQRAAEALLRIVDADEPPLRVLLGELAATMAPAAYRARLDEWARWEHLARTADFDEPSPVAPAT